MRARAVSLLLVSCWLGEASQAGGVDWDGGKPLTPPALGQGDRFGATLAIGKDVIVVGAYLSDLQGTDSGAVYFYEKEGESWKLKATVPGEAGDQLGFDLAIDKDGTRVIAGAPFARQNGVRCGAAFHLTVDQQWQVSKAPVQLPPGSCQEGAEIGSAVAKDGTREAIGARGADRRKGRVYAAFDGEGFQRLEAGVLDGDELGSSLAMDGGWLAAGAPFADQRGAESGALYVFHLAEGSQAPQGVQILPQTGQARAAFGYSIALRGGGLVAGAPLEDNVAGVDAGAVYRFGLDASTWTERGTTPGAQARAQFGVSVAQSEAGIFVGARRAGSHGRGAVYLLGGATFVSPQPQDDAEFGFAVAAGNGIFAAGAFLADGPARDSGAAYVFEPQPPREVTVSFAEESISVSEAEGSVALNINLSVETKAGGPLPTEVKVDLAFCPPQTGCTARKGIDFEPLRNPQTILAGTPTDGSYRLAVVPLVPDSELEGPRILTVRLTPQKPAKFGRPRLLKITIHDSPEIILPSALLPTREQGLPVPIPVRLASPPAGAVTVFLETTDVTEGSISGSPLVFTPANWDQVQIANLTGVDDPLCDGSQAYAVKVETRSKKDASYHGLRRTIPAENADDEPVSPSAVQSVCVHPDNTVIYTIELSDVCPEARASSFEYGLPAEVSVVTAGADTGTATVDYLAGSVVWNGSVPPAGNAVITIVGGLDPVAPGTEVVNPAFSTPPLSFDPVTFQAGEVGCFPEPP